VSPTRWIGWLMIGAALAGAGGCAVPQAQNTPNWQRREFEPSTGRAYWIYVPSTYTHAQAAPLIISCHGTPPYDVAEHHIREWKMLGEQNRCIVVAPELVATDGLLGDGPIVGMLQDERFILSIISYLGYQYNIDKVNIMITGFSGGGFPTYWVGLRHPEVFSVIAARNANFNRPNVDGWFTPHPSTPVIVYFGSNDPGVIRSQSQQAVEFLRSRGYAPTLRELPGVGHERHPEVAMDFFRRHWRTPQPSMRATR